MKIRFKFLTIASLLLFAGVIIGVRAQTPGQQDPALASGSMLNGEVYAIAEARLSFLTLSTANTFAPAFSPEITFYSEPPVDAAVPVTVTALAMAPNAVITANGIPVPADGDGASAPVPLDYGPNFIAGLCTAQDGITARTYTINITRLT